MTDALAEPTADEIARFLDVFRSLESFEATQRHVRGYGAFTANECPDPATVKVIAWLKARQAQLAGGGT